jgi:predicted nuclease of predicted toxin-antitoxin system
MNLSPRWVPYLTQAGYAARHWSTVGAADASDAEIMRSARDQTEIVVTNDLDFGTLLALTGDVGPSVVLLRAETLDPEAIGAHLCRCLVRFGPELNAGALLVLDEVAGKIRLLPIPRT